EAGAVGPLDQLAHPFAGRDEDARAPGFVDVRVEELGGARSERAVHEALDAADADVVVAEIGLDRPPGQLVALGDRPAQLHAAGELPLAGQPFVKAEELASGRGIAA